MVALTVHRTADARSAGLRAVPRVLLRGVRGVASALMREWRLRREIRSVERFSDSMLQDIGLGRGSIEEAVRHGRTRSGSGLYR